MYPGHPAHRGRIRHEDRVYPDQRSQFENGELFRKLTRESEVRLCLKFCVYGAKVGSD